MEAVRDWRDKYGHCEPAEIGLKRWCDRQRKRLRGEDYRAAPLQRDEIRRLQDVGIATLTKRNWTRQHELAAETVAHPTTGKFTAVPANLRDAEKFDTMYEEMKKFYEEHGHTVVSERKYPQLRQFLTDVRNEYKKIKAGQTSQYLTPIRMERLKQIEFSFEARLKRSFAERLAEFVEYRSKHGGKYPPCTSVLGKWVTKTRLRYHDTREQRKINYTSQQAHYLTEDQIAELERIGFEFGEREAVRVVKSFDERYEELLAFREGKKK